MTFLLVHGWGYHAGVWDALADKLQPHDVQRVDMGYFSESHIPTSFDEPVIAVGHSMGVLWLLTQTKIPFKGLVSIAGFDSFSAHVRPASLKVMSMGLERNPGRVLRDFWSAGGAAPFCSTDDANVEALKRGLDGLGEWDGREALTQLTCPVLALASRDDKIVSAEMSGAIWPEASLKWIETGNHALPSTQTDWCASEILDFADKL